MDKVIPSEAINSNIMRQINNKRKVVNMEEVWKDIPEYEGLYQVSNLGRVKCLGNGNSNRSQKRILKGNKSTDGYIQVKLSKDDKYTTKRVHRLVMVTFNPCDNMDELEVNHIDYDRTNNRLDNLEWVTHIENVHHSSNNGNYSGRYIGSKNPKSHFTEEQVRTIRTMYENGWKIPQIVYELYGVTNASDRKEYRRKHGWISDIVKYRTWKHIA